MKPRRRNGWRLKPELKSWLHLLPTQVQKPETEGFSADNLTAESLEVLKGPSFHRCVCFSEQHSVGFSQSSLIHLVGPLDCTLHNYVHGGQSLSLPFSSSSCSYNIFRNTEAHLFFILQNDVRLNLFLLSNGHLNILSWPNVLTRLFICLISQMLPDVNLLLPVVVN